MTDTIEAPNTTNLLQLNGKSKLECAVALAESGFTVLPLWPDTKGPPRVDGWQNFGPTGPAELDKSHMRESFSSDGNIAITTGRGFLVLDFDKKKGGCESLIALTTLSDLLPPTFRVNTQGGGAHLYFAVSERFSIGADVFDHLGYPGVDLRASGGYVVAPGSTIGSRRYTVANSLPMAPAPAWLLKALHSRRPAPAVEQIPLVELDTAENLRLATDWLINEAPEAVEGNSGDHTTANVIAPKLKDFGLSPQAAYLAASEHWNTTKAFPPWDESDLEAKIHSGYKSATRERPGIAIVQLPTNEFPKLPQSIIDAIDLQTKPQTDSRERPKTPLPQTGLIERRHQVTSPKTQWIVDGILPAKSFSVLYGQPGSFKSFVALHLADMIASHKPFLGKRTKLTDPQILYLAAEGGYGLRARLDASEQLHGHIPDTLGFIRHVLNLRSSRADADILLKAIAAGNWTPSLIIIDTLARSFGGGNENSSEDMGAFIDTVDYLREKADSAILAVHHSGKDTAKGTRGHSSLFGAVDAEFEVKALRPAPETGAGQGAGRFAITKQKDGPDGWSLDFVAEKVIFPRESMNPLDHDERERSSLAVREYRDGEATVVEVQEIRLSIAAHDGVRILREMCAASGGEVNDSNWKRAVLAAGIVPRDGPGWAEMRREMKAAGAYKRVSDRGVSVGEAFRLSAAETTVAPE